MNLNILTGQNLIAQTLKVAVGLICLLTLSSCWIQSVVKSEYHSRLQAVSEVLATMKTYDSVVIVRLKRPRTCWEGQSMSPAQIAEQGIKLSRQLYPMAAGWASPSPSYISTTVAKPTVSQSPYGHTSTAGPTIKIKPDN